MEVMERFVGRSGVRTLFNIEALSGKSIKAHSHYKRENEILLIPGTYFKVRSKWSPAENVFIIQLRETDPPWQLIAPPCQSILPMNPFSTENLTISTNSRLTESATSTNQFVKASDEFPGIFKHSSIDQTTAETRE
jgi:hypothetical protein